jgi:hypothetical protein
MKTVNELVKTIYLGDRACKHIVLDGWHKRFSIVIDRISRIRNPSGKWDFYSNEDIVDGAIVFEGLISFEFSPPGFVPCDWIEFIDVSPISDSSGKKSQFKATLSLGAIDAKGDSQEVTLTIVATSLHLENPAAPGLKIIN